MVRHVGGSEGLRASEVVVEAVLAAPPPAEVVRETLDSGASGLHLSVEPAPSRTHTTLLGLGAHTTSACHERSKS